MGSVILPLVVLYFENQKKQHLKAELEDLQNQYDIATGEIEIHKTIIKNIDDKF